MTEQFYEAEFQRVQRIYNRAIARCVAESAQPTPPLRFSWRCWWSGHDDQLQVKSLNYDGKSYEMLAHECQRCGTVWF